MKKELVLSMLFAALPMYAADNYLAVPRLATDRRPTISAFAPEAPDTQRSRVSLTYTAPDTHRPSLTQQSFFESLSEPTEKCRADHRTSITVSSVALPTDRIDRSHIRPCTSTQELIQLMHEEDMKDAKSNHATEMISRITVSLDDISSAYSIKHMQETENEYCDPLYDVVEDYFNTHPTLPTYSTSLDFKRDDVHYSGRLIPYHDAPKHIWHVKLGAKGYDGNRPQYFTCIRNGKHKVSITPISSDFYNLYDNLYEAMHDTSRTEHGAILELAKKKKKDLPKKQSTLCSCIIA